MRFSFFEAVSNFNIRILKFRAAGVGVTSCHRDALCPILSNGVKTGPVPPRREAEGAGGAHRAVIALAAAAIVVAGAAAFFVFPSLRIHLTTAGSTSNPAKSEKSIAVLPFENLSGDPDNAFFADGVQDDLLTKLATISDLKVISHTSVMHYRGKQDLRKVGKALGVSHVLEGTVRRSGGKVHVNARLVDTRTNTHLWAQDYDGRLNEVFAIEADVAQAAANRRSERFSSRTDGHTGAANQRCCRLRSLCSRCPFDRGVSLLWPQQ